MVEMLIFDPGIVEAEYSRQSNQLMATGMSDDNKLEILKFISSNATPGIPARLKFDSIGRVLNLTKQELDTLLVELNKERLISQYAKKGVDSFTVIINQKGLDAIED